MHALYDLYYDVNEKNNLINDENHQTIVEEMKSRLHDYMVETNDPLLDGPIKIKDVWKVNKVTSETASPKDPNEYE